MKKNEIIKYQENMYRVLSIKDNRILCVNCHKQNMPAWMNMPDDYEIVSADDLGKYVAMDELTSVQRNTAYQRFAMIAGIVAVIDDKQLYTSQIKAVSEAHNVSKQTIRSHLIKYLIHQNVAVLAPKEASMEHELSVDEKNFRWALNRYFYNQNQHTLQFTYKTMLQKKYCDSGGRLLPEYPSYDQFYYFYRKTRKMQNYLISRNGLGDYQRNDRPLLGDGVQEYCPNLGVGMVDGTVCDIYLVNDAGDVVGRPVLTTCIDGNTSMCMGYCLSWEGGIYNVRNLMQNVLTNKVEWCKQFGIQISSEDWPSCGHLPGRFITDKGSEYISHNFSQLTDIGCVIEDLAAFRPDGKSYVEKGFDILQGLFKQELAGKGVVEKDYGKRTNRIDYRKQACLTMRQFETILILCILHYNNNRIIRGYPYTEDMLRNGIKPYASGIWKYRLPDPSTHLIPVEERLLSLTMLPRSTGRFTRSGLLVNKLRYYCDGFTEEYLTGGDCVVSYSPDDVSRVWLLDQGGYIEFKLIESRYEGKSLQTVEELKELQRQILNKEETTVLQAKIDLSNRIKNVAAEFRNTNPETKGIRDRRKHERTKAHKEIGSEIE